MKEKKMLSRIFQDGQLKLKYFLGICIVVGGVICLLIFGRKEPEFAEGRVLLQEEEGDVVKIDSIYGQIQYPSMFSDVITVVSDEKDGYGCLEFYGELEHGTYLLYTLKFTEDEADKVGKVLDDLGNELYLHLEIAELPKKLTASDTNTFFALQETLNDVLTSLNR